MTRSDDRDEFAALERARREARHLWKNLRSDDPSRASAARRRFARLRSCADLAPDDAVAWRQHVRLKHALAVVAEERGYESWAAWKRAASTPPPEFHSPALGGFLFRWFADHGEARAAREQYGGYLLPFGSQCFVCEAQAVRELGLDPDDPDWRAVAFDLAAPTDEAARERLFGKRREAMRAGIAVPAPRRARR